jgi:hypothetical protein
MFGRQVLHLVIHVRQMVRMRDLSEAPSGIDRWYSTTRCRDVSATATVCLSDRARDSGAARHRSGVDGWPDNNFPSVYTLKMGLRKVAEVATSGASDGVATRVC